MKRVVFNVLFIISVLLLFIAVIRIANNKPILDTYSLLEAFSNAPKIFPDVLIPAFEIKNEWAILDGLRIFLNEIGSILGAFGYFSNVAVNILDYVFYFIRIIFII